MTRRAGRRALYVLLCVGALAAGLAIGGLGTLALLAVLS